MMSNFVLTSHLGFAADRRGKSSARRRVRAWTAVLVAFALAVAPVTSPPLMPAAAAQTPTDSGDLNKYGAVPQVSPPATTPPKGGVPTYSSIGGAPPPPAASNPKLPELGDSSQTMMSPAQERKLGEAIVRQIRGAGGYLDDPEVNDYLNELGNRLVTSTRDVRQDFVFFAVPDPQINAFALPGGFIGVNTGLILLAQNESQLASVLAHEISHVTQHHVTRMLANQQNVLMTTIAGLALAILASKVGGSNSGQATSAAIAGTQALSAQMQINFTRENEYEADRVGFSRLVAAGFDPNAMGAFFERLQRSSRFVEGTAPSYLRDHPVTYERIAEAKTRAQDLPTNGSRTLDFHMVRALLQSYQGERAGWVANFDRAIRRENHCGSPNMGWSPRCCAQGIPRAGRAGQAGKIAPPHPMVGDGGNVLMGANEYAAAAARSILPSPAIRIRYS
jgi:predicted Zn-dependent protease